jgi:general secretion pathway protein B
MSLILDALKRADAQRERSATPGVLTQPAAVLMPQGAGHSGRLQPRTWLIGLGLLLLTGATLVAWQWRGATERAPITTAAVVAPATQAAALPQPPSVPSVGQVTAPVAAPVASPSPSPLNMAPETSAAPHNRNLGTPATSAVPYARTPVLSATPTAPESSTKTVATRAIPAGTTGVIGTPKPTEPSAAVSAAPGQPPALDLAQLPANIRQQLPALTVSGSTYSSNPAHRMLIINGQVLREGDAVSEGQTLEQIRQNAAVLNFKGSRYLLKY